MQADLVIEYGLRRVPRPEDGDKVTVVELIDRFLEAPRVWSPVTYRSYGTPARFLARDRVGAVAMGRLTPSRMDTAIVRWVRDGAGPAVVLGRYRLIHAAITWGLHDRLLRFDPLAGHRARPAPLSRKHLRASLGRELIVEADRFGGRSWRGSGPNRRLCWSGWWLTAAPGSVSSPRCRPVISKVSGSPLSGRRRTAG